MGEDDYQNLIMYFKCLKKKNYLNFEKYNFYCINHSLNENPSY